VESDGLNSGANGRLGFGEHELATKGHVTYDGRLKK
jgi:hypothetical protein